MLTVMKLVSIQYGARLVGCIDQVPCSVPLRLGSAIRTGFIQIGKLCCFWN